MTHHHITHLRTLLPLEQANYLAWLEREEPEVYYEITSSL